LITGPRFKYNPTPGNIKTLCEISKNTNAGFAVDGDCDRLAVVDDNGKVVDINKLIITLSRGEKIVTTFETTRMLEKYARVRRVRTGDTFISSSLKKSNAFLGVEASGHFLWKDWLLYSDPIYTAYNILLRIKNHGKLSDMLSKIPDIYTRRFAVEYKEGVLHTLKSRLNANKAGDGFELSLFDCHVFFRKSQTEEKVRFTVEGKNYNACIKVENELKRIFKCS